MRTRTRLLSTALLLLFLCAGCGGDTANEDQAAAPDVEVDQEPDVEAEAPADTTLTQEQLIAQGESIFTGQGICYTCHGQDATGTQLAPDLTDDEWINIPEPVTREKIQVLVKTGVLEPVEHPAPMPAMGGAQLSEEELEAVSAYVYSLSQ